MKFINILILTIILNASWNLINHNTEVPEEVHVDIQAGLKNIISHYINQNLPSADNIIFHKFWSKTLGKNKIKASFSYSFNDADKDSGKTRVKIEGYALLNRVIKPDPDSISEDVEHWNFDELYILNNHVEFKDGLEITAEVPNE